MRRPDPPGHGVTDATIAAAALEILDAEGLAALSFRRLGERLGTSHMRIHRRCGSVEGLLEICAEHLAAQLPEIDPELPWAESIEARFTAFFDVATRHSALIALQRGRPWLGPEMMRRFAEPAVAASLAAGLTLSETVRVHRLLYMFTIGCALTYTTYDTERGPMVLDRLAAEDTPVLVAHRDRLSGEQSQREVFLDGIRLLIAAWDPAGQRRRATDRATEPSPGADAARR